MRARPRADVKDENPEDADYQAAKLRLFRSAFGEGVVSADVEVVGGCGEGTCEWTLVDMLVTMADGSRRFAHTAFGDYLRVVVGDGDVDELTGVTWVDMPPE